LSHIRARRVSDEDFETFDYILVMDRNNLDELLQRVPAEHKHKVRLFLEFAGSPQTDEVPDPYYGGTAGFDLVLDLVEQASERLLRRLRTTMRRMR
jgi:protein-tyrosine phosphatase